MAHKHRPSHPEFNEESMNIEKQKIIDLQHRLSASVGDFLVLLNEGNSQQIEHAKAKAKSDFLKYAPEMQHTAESLGGKFYRAVEDFLESIDMILHSAPGWIDEEKIARCYDSTQKLEKELKIA